MAKEEHLNILKQGVKPWNEWRKNNPNIQPDLSGADFRGESLSGVNLSNTLLNGAKLVRTSLIKANLTNANLNNAKLRWANLKMADLTGAELVSAEFYETTLDTAKLDKANLSKADFSKAQLHSASLNGANLSGAKFIHADLRSSKFEEADLTNANFENANLSSCRLQQAKLNGANLTGANLSKVNLVGSSIEGAILRGAHLFEADIRGLDFTNIDISNADFTKAIADERQFSPNQLSKRRREQLGFSVEITVKETAPEQTDEKQAKYGEGKYGEGVYGGKGGQEGDQKPEDEDEDSFREAFLRFLEDEKGYTSEYIRADIKSEDPVTHVEMDLVLIVREKEENAAVIEFTYHNRPNALRIDSARVNRYRKNINKPNIPAYIVCPAKDKTKRSFEIYEVLSYKEPKLVLHEEFPSFEELISGDKGELESTIPNLSKFMKHLNDNGRRLCKRIIERAGKNDLRFKIEAPTDSYINLKISNPQRTAVQLHRWGDLRTSIALAIAGTTTEWPEPKYDQIIKKGNIETLSGYLSGNQPEIRWLKGRARGFWLRYEAEVYIIEPQVLEHEGAWKELELLLMMAMANANIGKETEPEKVSKYGKGGIATIQMDRLSNVDLLGRDKLVEAFAGMFVHTEEVEGFTVALLGDWGEGKSTVMKLLKESLSEKNNGKFEFATFNAWEYERTDNIAAGLAQEVVNGLIEPLQQQCWERQKLRFKFALKEYKGELCRLAIYSLVAILIIFISHVFFENNTLKGLGLAGGIAALIFLLFKSLPTIIEHPIAIKLETYLKLPNYGKHLGDIPIIQSHLKTLCSLRLVDNKKLIVFVDDLDRCQTDCIARALDAIRLVMSIPNVIVMIGIDYRIAFKAMENYYEKLGDKERDKSEIARDYLGKIIQLPVQLIPSSTEEVRKYIEKRLFPDAQIMEDIEKDAEIDTERDVIEQQKLIKERIEAEGEEVKVRIPDDKKVEEPKSVEEILKDTSIERDMFSDLAQRFNFTNPRQLLRLRNSYRFLKVMDSDEKYDREILMKILFWHEFLNNWPSIIRDQCEKSVTKQESLEKIEKPEAKQIVQGVQEDILKIIEMPMYEEIERFVRIVVLPHSEEGVLEAR